MRNLTMALFVFLFTGLSLEADALPHGEGHSAMEDLKDEEIIYCQTKLPDGRILKMVGVIGIPFETTEEWSHASDFLVGQLEWFERNHGDRDGYARPLGWGRGFYSLFGEEMEFYWFAWTNYAGYLQFRLSMPLNQVDLEIVRGISDPFEQNCHSPFCSGSSGWMAQVMWWGNHLKWDAAESEASPLANGIYTWLGVSAGWHFGGPETWFPETLFFERDEKYMGWALDQALKKLEEGLPSIVYLEVRKYLR